MVSAPDECIRLELVAELPGCRGSVTSCWFGAVPLCLGRGFLIRYCHGGGSFIMRGHGIIVMERKTEFGLSL